MAPNETPSGSPSSAHARTVSGATAIPQKAYDQLPVSLVVTDPSLPDNPIVYVNPAFTQLTGYSSEASCGRNCRFLQGEDTDPDTVAKLAAAIGAGESVSVQLLNYRANGRPFRNALIVAPIVEDGQTLFFLGVQAEATDANTDTLPDKLQAIHSQVHEQAASVLALIRGALGTNDEPERVTSVLTSRLNALAQLYGGVFRMGASEYKNEARLGAYLARVCSATHLADRSYNTRLNTSFVECSAELRTAATVGLILSELLANAFGESNPYDPQAAITVRFDWCNGVACLSVADESRRDGGSLLPQPDTVGGRIMETLGRQIGIEVEEGGADGSERSVRVRFPTLKREELSTIE